MVSITKNGIMSASGEINENLLIGSSDYVVNTLGFADGARREYVALNVGQSYMDVPSNTVVTISFDLEMRVKTVDNANPQLTVYNSNNKGPKTFANKGIKWTNVSVGDTIKEHITMTVTIIDRENPTISYNVIEFYSTYGTNNYYKITNLKMELGNVPTPWCPNELDDIYTGNVNGFIESSDLSRISKEYIEGNNFYEY